jgi:serine/threonine protein kinase
MIGTTFGRYVIESKLGVGSMGVVYRARDLRLDREVAIKVLNQSLLSDPTAWGWLLREAKIASALNHPCICTVHDIGEEAGQPYIAMEYVEGQTLGSLLIPSGLPPTLVRRYGSLIADALGHAHERGIIHRDIKSSNVLATPDGALTILDFGLSRRIRLDSQNRLATSSSSIDGIGPIVGTTHYMAPEILRGERAYVWSDIWSLGVLIYEMASGILPFVGNTVFELTTAIMASEMNPIPERVPAYLARVIGYCLKKDPTARYHCARDVANDLAKPRSNTMRETSKHRTPMEFGRWIAHSYSRRRSWGFTRPSDRYDGHDHNYAEGGAALNCALCRDKSRSSGDPKRMVRADKEFGLMTHSQLTDGRRELLIHMLGPLGAGTVSDILGQVGPLRPHTRAKKESSLRAGGQGEPKDGRYHNSGLS